jgi:DNA-directed RNA polymerase subunit RPC12/RpoP
MKKTASTQTDLFNQEPENPDVVRYIKRDRLWSREIRELVATTSCPHCGSRKITYFEWGQGGFGPEHDKLLKEGLLIQKGCISYGEMQMPDFTCRECKKEFSKAK